MTRKRLTENQKAVMWAALRLHPNGYGLSIADEIFNRTGAKVALSSVHDALERLREIGYLTDWLGEPTPERGGRRKLHYKLTADGRKALDLAAKQFDSLRGEDTNLVGARR